MLDRETRQTVLTLHEKGHGKRAIARALGISRNSVNRVLKEGRADPPPVEKGSILDDHIDEIRELYAECRGNLVRVWEELGDTGCRVSYPTLTRFCRDNGVGAKEKVPTVPIITAPGEEMQHDTSPYKIKLGGKKVLRHCASLVFGYSRMMYIQFYPKFDRFHCKIFLTDAFRYLEGVCRRCVIDNSSIVIACGAGHNAQVAPEMEAFEKRFGFHFLAHAVGHANRSGKVERPFDYIERNFLAGRVFGDDEDLNRQAVWWLEERANVRRIRALKARPVELFAAERHLMVPLPIHVPDVYRPCQRRVDEYSCVSLHSMKYPVPADHLGKMLMIREYKDHIVVLDGIKEVARHVKRTEGSPPPDPPSSARPRRLSRPHLPEEDRLKAMGQQMSAFLRDMKLARPSRYVYNVRKLYRLLCHYEDRDLIAAVKRAKEHRLFDVKRIEIILLQEIAGRDYHLPLQWEADPYQHLEQYRKGAATPEPRMEDYTPGKDDDDADRADS